MLNRTVLVADHPDLVTATETARLLGMTERSLQRLAREGKGPRRQRIGSRAYYYKPDIESWLRNKFS